MKLYQKNKDNTEGFIPVGDFGHDSSGELAPGYQHHDGLWYPGSEKHGLKDKSTVDECVNFFSNCFSAFASNCISRYGVKSVLDLGCGSGILTHAFRSRGVNTCTVDANPIAAKDSPYIDENHFLARTDKALDIRDEQGNRKKFDLITSFDHVEHIEDKTIHIFMSNVKEHLADDGIFIFIAHTFTYPGDQAHIHCNTSPKEYWIQKLEENGMREIVPDFRINRSGGDAHEIFAKLA